VDTCERYAITNKIGREKGGRRLLKYFQTCKNSSQLGLFSLWRVVGFDCAAVEFSEGFKVEQEEEEKS
jgi:hypothetical protein